LAKESDRRSQPLRDDWDEKLASWRANQLVFLDESGINSKLGERDNGWGKKGERVRCKVRRQRACNLSLLPALTMDGYLAFNIYQGSVNAERFYDFIEQDVLPHCNPYPGPRSILVFDNASVHRGEVILFLKL